jgi:hypothetical protein
VRLDERAVVASILACRSSPVCASCVFRGPLSLLPLFSRSSCVRRQRLRHLCSRRSPHRLLHCSLPARGRLLTRCVSSLCRRPLFCSPLPLRAPAAPSPHPARHLRAHSPAGQPSPQQSGLPRQRTRQRTRKEQAQGNTAHRRRECGLTCCCVCGAVAALVRIRCGVAVRCTSPLVRSLQPWPTRPQSRSRSMTPSGPSSSGR